VSALQGWKLWYARQEQARIVVSDLELLEKSIVKVRQPVRGRMSPRTG